MQFSLHIPSLRCFTHMTSIVFIMCAIAAAQEPPPTTSSPYFPLVVGTTWYYRPLTSRGLHDQKEYTKVQEVVSTAFIGGHQFFLVKTTYPGIGPFPGQEYSEFFRVHNDSVFVLRNDSVSRSGPPRLMLILPPTAQGRFTLDPQSEESVEFVDDSTVSVTVDRPAATSSTVRWMFRRGVGVVALRGFSGGMDLVKHESPRRD